MSISASQIVKVTPRVINAGGAELQTVGLILTENELCPFPRTLTFATASAVGDYFGLDSKEYEMATLYFLGYDNSFRKPRNLHFGRYAKNPITATYIGAGSVADMVQIKAITNGKIVFEINGTRKVCKGLDFSAEEIVTQSDVAQKLATALGNVSVAYNSNLNEFIITGGANESSSIKFVGDGGGNEEYTVVARYDLTSTATGQGYSVAEDGLYKAEDGGEPVLQADWETVNANWDESYVTLFEEQENGSVYRYNWEGDVYTCYGVPEITTEAVAKPLGLDVGTAWDGNSAKTPSQNMASIIEYDQNWVTFTTLNEVDKETTLEFAKWVNGTECEYLYSAYTTRAEDKNPLATDNLPNSLKEKNYEGVVVSFGDTPYAIFVMTIGACIDWDRNNGLITYAFKTQSGLEATIDNDTDASNCERMGVNFYGNYKARSDEFLWYYQGKMIGGQFGFVDAYIGQLWLRNVLQIAILNGLGQIGRVPYTEEGYTYIRAWCADPIKRALKNGVIDTGVAISEAQKSALFSEIGEDVADQIFLDGYYLLVDDPPSTVRAERGTPTCGLYYSYGGSVHKVNLATTVVL